MKFGLADQKKKNGENNRNSKMADDSIQSFMKL